MPHELTAAFAQRKSHWTPQQNGSAAHTDWQQVASLQYGPGCCSQQSPVEGLPQVTQLAHDFSAALAHSWSHCVLQQNGSAAQIDAQQVSSEQPGAPFAVQQLFPFGAPHGSEHTAQALAAASAHSWSHCESQQKESAAQTDWQQAASEHPGSMLGRQQSLPFGAPQTPCADARSATKAAATREQRKVGFSRMSVISWKAGRQAPQTGTAAEDLG